MPASDDPNVLVNEVNPVSPENLHKIFVIDLNYLSSLSTCVIVLDDKKICDILSSIRSAFHLEHIYHSWSSSFVF